MDLSVIIVNYKSIDKTRQCLAALNMADFTGISHEIIVVDNASGDNVDALKIYFPRVRIIKSPANSGMGEGNNLGIRNSFGDFLLILNPDTYLEKEAIQIMFRYMKNYPRAGIVGPKLLNPDGSLQNSCLRFPKLYTPILRRTSLGKFFKKHLDDFIMADFNHAEARVVDWMMGSALMVKRAMLEKIGPAFDKRFFMFFEDTDLCRRAKEAGYQAVYLPEALGTHDHSRASAQGRWYIAIFTNQLARAHIASWFKYFWKWRDL